MRLRSLFVAVSENVNSPARSLISLKTEDGLKNDSEIPMAPTHYAGASASSAAGGVVDSFKSSLISKIVRTFKVDLQ